MMWEGILAGWGVFNLFVYTWMWYDDMYYTHNLSQKFKQVKNVLTEE